MAEFREFPKIHRLFRHVFVTEKIDGTNACVVVDEDGTVSARRHHGDLTYIGDGQVGGDPSPGQQWAPKCCHVVPILGHGNMNAWDLARSCIETLREKGSFAAPGFMKPEGVVVFHTAANMLFKATLEKDEERKSQVAHG